MGGTLTVTSPRGGPTVLVAQLPVTTTAATAPAAPTALSEQLERKTAMLILDAGAFVAVERGDRDVVALIKRERLAGRAPLTHGGVIAQIWRGGAHRQASVARLLNGVEVVPLDLVLGREAGVLLAASGTSDAINSAVVCLAADGDDILTSDVSDLRELAQAADLHVELIRV